MAKTNLQRNTSLYEKIIKDAENSPHAKDYQDVCKKLKKLVEISKNLKNNSRKMTPDQYKTLTESYEKVKAACDGYFQKQNEFSDFEKKRAEIFQDIATVLEKDIAVLKSCDPKAPISLSEVWEKSRTHRIILNKDKLETVGGALSSRKPIRLNDGRKGFFTPINTYNQDAKWTEKLKTYEDTFGGISEECKGKLDLLKHDEAFQIAVSRCIWKKPVTKDKRNDPEVNQRVLNLACELGMGKSEDEVKALFSEKPQLYDSMIDFMNSVIGIAGQQRIMAISGIKKGDTISTRNCAMTDVAKMLGCQKLLANSTKMTVVIGDEEIQGVFMETAEGSDTHRIKKDDLLLRAKPSSFGSVNGIQQVLDLQVLDFICGNTDRHTANMCYKFKKINSKDVMFTGIQGIDNDCAFGRVKPSPDKPIMKLVNPQDMKYITQTMFKKLKSFDKNALELKLAHYNFSNEEIEAVWDRYQMIMDALKNRKILVVKRSDLELNPPTREDGKKNYIGYIFKMAEKCAYKDYHDMVNEDNKIKYAQEVYSANHIMLENEDAIKKLRDEMNNAKARIFNTSEYNLMAGNFEKIEELTKKIKEIGPDNVSAEMTDELTKAYVGLAETTTKYMMLKSVVPSTERGEKRLAFARHLKSFADITLEKMGVQFEKEEKSASKEENVMEDDNEFAL